MASRDGHPAALPPDELLRECDVRRLRRSGPGGQHRNKVETAVALRHRPTGVEAEAAERRSQSENQSVALRRLRINLAVAVRRATAADAPPSPLWRSRCRDGRIAVNTAHADFPAVLAEALDAIESHGLDVKAAAEQLGITASQVVKLLKSEPRAFAQVNTRRAERGLHRLK